jgi:hypothetical protein
MASPRPCAPPVMSATVDWFRKKKSSGIPGHPAIGFKFNGFTEPK